MTKRTATPAQQAAAKERRAQWGELCKRLAAMGEAERAAVAAKMLAVTVEGRTLSINNQMLLAMQRDAITIVGGFQQWKRNGRSVRRGEHGLMIWCATGRTDEAQAETPEGDDARPNFIMGTVFDVSQTEPTT